jgi:hypothetical protein
MVFSLGLDDSPEIGQKDDLDFARLFLVCLSEKLEDLGQPAIKIIHKDCWNVIKGFLDGRNGFFDAQKIDGEEILDIGDLMTDIDAFLFEEGIGEVESSGDIVGVEGRDFGKVFLERFVRKSGLDFGRMEKEYDGTGKELLRAEDILWAIAGDERSVLGREFGSGGGVGGKEGSRNFDLDFTFMKLFLRKI